MSTPHTDVIHDCPLCIHGWSPAGIHPIIGPSFAICPAEQPCWGCNNESVYPGEVESVVYCNTGPVLNGYPTVVCPVCHGILQVGPDLAVHIYRRL